MEKELKIDKKKLESEGWKERKYFWFKHGEYGTTCITTKPREK